MTSFAKRLGLVTAAALILRIAYVVWFERTHVAPAGDAFYYQYQANAIAKGHWFIEPYVWQCFHHKVQSAAHPPLSSKDRDWRWPNRARPLTISGKKTGASLTCPTGHRWKPRPGSSCGTSSSSAR